MVGETHTVTTAWCTELGTTLLNGFANTTDIPAYFRCLSSSSVALRPRKAKFLPRLVLPYAGAALLSVLRTGATPPDGTGDLLITKSMPRRHCFHKLYAEVRLQHGETALARLVNSNGSVAWGFGTVLAQA